MLINGEQVADVPDFMNMDMSNVLNIGGLATVARSTEGEKRAPELERETAGDRFSFLHIETVKVSRKPIIKCIMCHILVPHLLRDWKADLELCGSTTLSWSSWCLFCLMKSSPVTWPSFSTF